MILTNLSFVVQSVVILSAVFINVVFNSYQTIRNQDQSYTIKEIKVDRILNESRYNAGYHSQVLSLQHPFQPLVNCGRKIPYTSLLQHPPANIATDSNTTEK